MYICLQTETFDGNNLDYTSVRYGVNPQKLDHQTALTPKMQEICTQVRMWECSLTPVFNSEPFK